MGTAKSVWWCRQVASDDLRAFAEHVLAHLNNGWEADPERRAEQLAAVAWGTDKKLFRVVPGSPDWEDVTGPYTYSVCLRCPTANRAERQQVRRLHERAHRLETLNAEAARIEAQFAEQVKAMWGN